MRVKRRDAEQWMSHRLLPESLRERIRRYEQYRWQETRGVDEESLLSNLPKDIRRDIKRHLCLALLMRVSRFSFNIFFASGEANCLHFLLMWSSYYTPWWKHAISCDYQACHEMIVVLGHCWHDFILTCQLILIFCKWHVFFQSLQFDLILCIWHVFIIRVQFNLIWLLPLLITPTTR